LAAGDEKMGFHALQEKQAAKKKADRVEALKRLGKAFRKTEPEIDEAKLLQQILDAAKNKDTASVVARAKKGLGEEVDEDVNEQGFHDELTAIKNEQSLKKLLSSLSRGEEPDNPAPLYDVDYWRSLSRGLTIARPGGVPEGSLDLPDAHMQGVSEGLRSEGYFRARPGGWDVDFNAVLETVKNIVAHGWPAVFIYMFDEPWQILERAWDVYESAIGHESILEPTVYCWFLQPALGGANRKSASQNFGMPHRDYRYSESCLDDGQPKLITVWIPLTPTDVHNGTIYVLPKEHDEYFAQNESWEHMRGALTGEDSVVQELRFPVQGATPIEAQPGDCLGWMGNLIHWGSRCSAHVTQPRANLGCTFRRKDVENFNCGLPPIGREQLRAGLALPFRMKHITRSLLLYSCHFDLPRTTLPAQFWKAYDVSDDYVEE